MKLKIALLTLVGINLSQAASTIAFSSTTNFATNFLNSASLTPNMVWGILVDSDRNGFLEDQYLPGFSLAGGTGTNAGAPIALSTSTGVTGDILIISGNLMNQTTTAGDSGASGLNRITGLNSFAYTSAMELGDPFKIIWFEKSALGGVAAAGDKYGTFQSTTLNTLPVDPTPSVSYAGAFAGADIAKPMSFTVVPEPSSALLLGVGVLGLLRRRRI